MTTVAPKPIVTRPWPVRKQVKGQSFARILRTTDAKLIGIMYMVTSFVYFAIGGVLAMAAAAFWAWRFPQLRGIDSFQNASELSRSPT